MTTVRQIGLAGLLGPVRLTGPLLGKELRVSSRRRRNYAVRFFYIALLTGFMAIVWAGVVEFQGNATVVRSRMAMAGKTVVSTVVVFQFVATQVLAIIMLSTAIGDEVYHRTLGLLMTTPITGYQIALGKLLSRVLQLLQLLALNLPLLAVIRVFGGVPVEYLISSFCITFTAVLFAGSVSLYFSIGDLRSYAVIIKTAFVLAMLYVGFPFIAMACRGTAMLGSWMSGSPFSSTILGRGVTTLLVNVNPLAMIGLSTREMLSGGATAGFVTLAWPAHCVFILLLVAIVMVACAVKVHRVALRQARGLLEFTGGSWWRNSMKSAGHRPAETPVGKLKTVKGSPVLWRELRAPAIQGVDNTNSAIGFTCAVGALFVTYMSCLRENSLSYEVTQVLYVLMFVGLGTLFMLVRSATSLTVEKESRTWPLLLATPVSSGRILWDKAMAIWRRAAPIWLFAAGHVIVFVVVGYIHVSAILHLGLLLLWLITFTTGSGLYFSARLRRSTSAVVANLALAVVLWLILPVVLSIVMEIFHDGELPFALLTGNPAVQTVVVFNAAGGADNATAPLSGLGYKWPGETFGFGKTTAILAGWSVVYVSAGAIMAWRAKTRFRKDIF